MFCFVDKYFNETNCSIEGLTNNLLFSFARDTLIVNYLLFDITESRPEL